jgi:hypothetical protein
MAKSITRQIFVFQHRRINSKFLYAPYCKILQNSSLNINHGATPSSGLIEPQIYIDAAPSLRCLAVLLSILTKSPSPYIMLDVKPTRILPIVENLRAQKMASHTPNGCIRLSGEMIVAEELGVEVLDLEGAVV